MLVVVLVDNELTVRELIRLTIPKLISAINIHTIINVRFFFASFTSAHLADSMIRMIPLYITIVTASTIVILRRNLAILTISGASWVTEAWNRLLFHVHHKISLQKAASSQVNHASFF